MCARGQLALLVKSEDTRFLQNKVTYGGPIPTPNAYPAFSCAAFIFFFPQVVLSLTKTKSLLNECDG